MPSSWSRVWITWPRPRLAPPPWPPTPIPPPIDWDSSPEAWPQPRPAGNQCLGWHDKTSPFSPPAAQSYPWRDTPSFLLWLSSLDLRQSTACWCTKIVIIIGKSSKIHDETNHSHLQELVDLVGQLVDDGGVCLLGDLLLGLLGDELVVAGAARGELQQEVWPLLVASHASHTVLECE